MAVAEIEKKANAKARHEEAIIEFQAWLEQHPKATLKQQVQKFDMFMDYAYIRSRLP